MSPYRFRDPTTPPLWSRRQFVSGLAAGGAIASLGLSTASAHRHAGAGVEAASLRGSALDLRIGRTAVNFTGNPRLATTLNGSLPGPVLRWREGDEISIRITNQLDETSSVHWHGLLLPANMDGVPGLSFDGIGAGETFTYRFALRQSGTYWYHSHSHLQEQAGLYGAIVIEPRAAPPYHADREHVLVLSDWTDLSPGALLRRLKKMSSYDNFHKRTVVDFLHDIGRHGLAATLQDRRQWGAMRMTPTDLSDVNANTYTYLLNGCTPATGWTGLFRPGEKVLLRFINASAMSYFDVRIPGLKMTVVAADGQYIHPVSVDEFRIAVAETFDVLVEPRGQDAFAVFAQDMGRTGYARGTLAVNADLQAPVPPLDPRPLLRMDDMGHGGMSHGAHSMRKGAEGRCGGHHMPAAATPDSVMPGMSHDDAAMTTHPASEQGNPLIDMQTMAPQPRLDDPGVGLRDNGRTVLTYAAMHSLFTDPDGREPGRDIELHLTGHMEKFAWSFNGQKFMDAQPLRLKYGERARIVLVNDTMMTHPIHLHGLWSDVEDAHGNFQLRKHTVDMPPGTRRSYRVRADALGRWAYHCHLLYHMEAGMMREVRVEE